MSASTNPIVVDPKTLSRAITNVLANAKSGKFDKNTALNELAREIAGTKHNWGYLTGAKAPLFSRSLRGKFDLRSTNSADLEAQGTLHYPALRELGFSTSQCRMIADKILSNPFGMILIGGDDDSNSDVTIKRLASALQERSEHRQIELQELRDTSRQPIFGDKSFGYHPKIYVQKPWVKPTSKASDPEGYQRHLSSLLRTDPDVAILPKIDEKPEIDKAFFAALCGYHVMATINAGSAIEIANLLRQQWKVDDYKVFDPTVVAGLIVQKSIPVLCPACKIPLTSEGCEGDKAAADIPLYRRLIQRGIPRDRLSNVHIRSKDGCPCCSKGVTGRTLVAEVAVPDEKFMDCCNKVSMGGAMPSSGHPYMGISIYQHALAKVLAGTVSPADLDSLFPARKRISNRDIAGAVEVANEYRRL